SRNFQPQHLKTLDLKRCSQRSQELLQESSHDPISRAAARIPRRTRYLRILIQAI
ncbi:hypothetical protein BGW38_004974, partial [Lunasporangiospora selenospora]